MGDGDADSVVSRCAEEERLLEEEVEAARICLLDALQEVRAPPKGIDAVIHCGAEGLDEIGEAPPQRSGRYRTGHDLYR